MDMDGIFRRSSFCHNGSCVEVALGDDGSALLRDGTDPTGPALAFTADEWTAFIQGAKAGEFDV
jgi:hypothetical protein